MNRVQLQLLKDLQQHEGWDVLIQHLGERLDSIKDRNVIGNNEFETLKLTFMREGGIQELKDFFNNLEREVQ